VIWVFVVIGAVLVIGIAFVALGQTVGRLERERPPAVYELPDAVDWIADRLPDEVTARVSYHDVARVLRWHLDWFAAEGVATRHGEELAGEGVGDEIPVVASEDTAVDAIVARSLAEGGPEAVDVVCILDLQMRYLELLGAFDPADDGDDPADGGGPTGDPETPAS
jgi:hypothetical protein